MTQADPISSLGVVTVSSVAYLRTMLTALQNGQVTVPLRDAQDADRIRRGHVDRVETPEAGGGWLSMPFVSPDGDARAMISFTSGTEGPPKAVHLSQGNLHDVVGRLQDVMGLTSDVREYIGVPVYHSFGYGRARAVLNAKGACYLPHAGFDLIELRTMLRAKEINAISAVPSLWRLFLQQRDMFGPELDAVRWVEIGSQYMGQEEKRALREALPNACIVQHYGLTEASRSTFLSVHSATDDTLESVGQPTGAVQVRINAQGRICVAGPHVAIGVEDQGRYTPLPQGAWFETSDQGRLGADGTLFFEGRADDIINCGGIKLSPDLVEAHVRKTLPDVTAFGVLRCADSLRGDGIMVALTPKTAGQGDAIVAAVDAYAETQGLKARSAIVTREVPTLPRTATGKLERKALMRGLETSPTPDVTQQAEPQTFWDSLVDLLGATAQAPDASFETTSGDSLAHMQVTLMLERALGTAPEGWEWTPLRVLADQVDAAGAFEDLMQAPAGAPPLPDGTRNENPPGLSFWALVAEDFRTNDASIFHQGFLMLLVHRFGNWRMAVRPRLLRIPLSLLYRFLNKLTQLFFGMKLDYTVKVGRRVKLEHFGGMILGAREIQDDVILRQNTTFGIRATTDLNAKPTIGARVDIGAGAVIVGNITIGADSIIGSNTVVFRNIPPGSVVMGVPGKIIGQNPRIGTPADTYTTQ